MTDDQVIFIVGSAFLIYGSRNALVLQLVWGAFLIYCSWGMIQ